MITTGAPASAPTTQRTATGQSTRANASPPQITVGAITAPAAVNSGVMPTMPIIRTMVSSHRRRTRRRATATMA